MPKEKMGDVSEKSVSQREALWKEYVANYKKSNPVKGAAKEARGEFNNIPDSFRGIKNEKGQIL